MRKQQEAPFFPVRSKDNELAEKRLIDNGKRESSTSGGGGPFYIDQAL